MKTFIRILIVLGWIFLISAVLYFPRVKILPKEDRSLTVFAWGESIDPKILEKFEQDTGIKIYLNYFSTNEELMVKMRATRGEGYDLIMPSDYAVSLMIKDDLLQPLDKTKLPFLSNINPSLLSHTFDPNNTYSVPFEWEVYGLGVDTDFFQNRPIPDSWSAIFDASAIDYRIAMNNDPVEAVQFASFYLFNRTTNLSEENFQRIRELLLQQRSWVEAYTNFRPDYFIATKSCPLAISFRSMIKRIERSYPNIAFIIPKEGSFISIESFCIPKLSDKADYAYQLLNYLYQDDSMITHYENFGLFPATLSGREILDLEPYEKQLLYLTRDELNAFHFFKNVFPQIKTLDLWVEVKSF